MWLEFSLITCEIFYYYIIEDTEIFRKNSLFHIRTRKAIINRYRLSFQYAGNLKFSYVAQNVDTDWRGLDLFPSLMLKLCSAGRKKELLDRRKLNPSDSYIRLISKMINITRGTSLVNI